MLLQVNSDMVYLARPIKGTINFPPVAAKKQPKQFYKGDLVMIIEKTQRVYIGGAVSSDLKEETTFYKKVIAHYLIGPLKEYREVKSLLSNETFYTETAFDGLLEFRDVEIPEGETELEEIRRTMNGQGPKEWKYEYYSTPMFFKYPMAKPDSEFMRKLYDALEEQSSKFKVGWKVLKKQWNWKG